MVQVTLSAIDRAYMAKAKAYAAAQGGVTEAYRAIKNGVPCYLCRMNRGDIAFVATGAQFLYLTQGIKIQVHEAKAYGIVILGALSSYVGKDGIRHPLYKK